MRLVEQSALLRARLRRERGDDGLSLRVQRLAQTADERGVVLAQLRRDVLEVYVEAVVSLFRHRLQNLGKERALRAVVLQERRGVFARKIPLRRQRREVHERFCAIARRTFEQARVVERCKDSRGRDAVGERRQIRQVRQDRVEQLAADVGVGVGVHAERTERRFVCVVDGKHVALAQKLASVEEKVPPQERPDAQIIVPRDGRKRLPRAHGVQCLRRPHDERLADHKRRTQRKAVVRRDERGQGVVHRGDGRKRVAALYNMNVHGRSPRAILCRIFRAYPSATSSIIIRRKPTRKPHVPRRPPARGSSSSATT